MEKVPDVIWKKLLGNFKPTFLTQGMILGIDRGEVFRITDGYWYALLFNEVERVQGKVGVRVYMTNFVPFAKEQLQSEALAFLKEQGFE